LNSNGEIVDVPVEGMMDKGRYEKTISTVDLSSGVYLVNIVSGPYTDTKRLVIVK
jgi:hypothetical protein